MAQYHIHPATELPELCEAASGSCRYGAAVPHFSTPDDAATAFAAARAGVFSPGALVQQLATGEDSFPYLGEAFPSDIWFYQHSLGIFSTDQAEVALWTRTRSFIIAADSDGGYGVVIEKKQTGGWWGSAPGEWGFKTVSAARKAAEKLALEETAKYLSKLKRFAAKKPTPEDAREELKQHKAKLLAEPAE